MNFVKKVKKVLAFVKKVRYNRGSLSKSPLRPLQIVKEARKIEVALRK